ncbi:MAG: EI24 domain-containing protein [Pseudomonadota bacterium]
MFSSLTNAIRQSFDPAFRSVFIRSLFASIATFLILWVLCSFALDWVGGLLSGYLESKDTSGWISDALLWLFNAGGVAAVLVTSFFLFPAVMLLTMSFLLEDVARAVEERYYPGLPTARGQPWTEIIGGALAFAGITLLVNIVALPLYLALLFLPPLNLFVFYLFNGYLLGREYFELVAVRRVELTDSNSLRRSHRGRLLLAGMIIAFLLTIPLINLFTPIIATAFMLHVFQKMPQQASLT